MIVDTLTKFSKVELDEKVKKFVLEMTQSYGKVKLVLRRNKFTIESRSLPELKKLYNNPKMLQHRAAFEAGPTQSTAKMAPVSFAAITAANDPTNTSTAPQPTPPQHIPETSRLEILDADDDDANSKAVDVYSFEIPETDVEPIKKIAMELGMPLLSEYDFRNDASTPNLDIDLKPTTTIRPYQEKSLSKMFSNGRARSGVIVLPCGAGKTLVGITAACTVKKSVLVLCSSNVAVEQWKSQFKLWTTVDDKSVSMFTSHHRSIFETISGVCVTTYSMLAWTGKRSQEAKCVMDRIQKISWGLMLLDEVHVAPAEMFRKVVSLCKAHCILGLTATLVREDSKIKDLNFLVGPKLYEANWLDLQRDNYIATVSCAEVWCPMTKEFYSEYLSDSKRVRLLVAMNPNKFICCKFLIDYHSARNDKVIVFSDNIVALEWYARKLRCPFIHGPTPQHERMRVLNDFQNNPSRNCIFISKVGDTAIDLPGANVIIQISSHFGARRQEAQRLGRILRAKPRKGSQFNAFFYSLVSKDTEEMYYSQKRQQFLVDQVCIRTTEKF
eukprot:c17372_g1_i5.p1 GENE.c17372_g1_i5~~c17372_g1_i5.p1  ORF type:complete len:555 (+),score=142.48 c17372_g1_i5:453-2117(+)